MKRFERILGGFAALLLLPAVAHAQASVAGVVRDATGAVLPGVTVEASSSALIERTRTAVSDGSGQYRIENLRPGIYSVKFTLSGFSTVSREGVELSGTATTVTVNADLKVGSLAETVTVTGETPVVDLQSAQRQAVLTNEVIKAIPTAGSYNALLVLVPGILGGQQDVAAGPCNSCTFSAHGTMLSLSGNRANTDGRLMVDGISIAVPQAGGTNYLTDTRNAQEVTFTVTGSLGEVESGGPVMNIIPRSGGNSLSGSGFVAWANDSLQSSNLNQQLKDLKIPESPLIKSYDLNASVGGPIKRDRMWFFGTVRGQGNSAYLPIYYNKNAGDPNKWLYEPDLSRQAFNDKTWQNGSARVTAQLTPRNKLNLFWDEQDVCRSCQNGGNYANGTTSPEGNGYGDLRPMRFQSVGWTSPVSSRLMLESGFGYFFSRWGGRAKDDPYTGDLVRIIEQCSAGCAANGGIPSLMYRSQTTDLFSDGRNKNITTTWRFTAAYVTGGTSMKFGYIGNQLGDLRSANRSPNDLRYRTNNGVPNQLTEFVHDQQNDLWMRNHAFFVQDQWTRGRLTLQGGLRFDRASSWAPEQHLESRFWLTSLDFAETPVVDSYNDITPRAAVSYDLFGNGRTALKATVGKYVESTITASNYGLGNPTSRIATNVTRTWTDTNGNWNPDCNLTNSAQQDLRSAGGDFCGVISNLNFGTSTFSNTIDPEILHGWGIRPSDWDWGVSVQHEVLPRTSVEVGFFHRSFYGFTVTDNLAVTPADFTQFSITAPKDARLPGGGGYQVGTLYNLNVPSLFGVTRNYVTYTDAYGDVFQKYNGIDVSFSARPRSGLTMQGGFSGGYSTSDNCAVREKVPELGPLNAGLLDPYCHIETSFLPQYKALASYVVPKIDVALSGTFTSKPGIQVSGFGTPVAGGAFAANYTISNAEVAPILGRNLAGNAPNITVNLVEPHSVLGERVNELDLRLGKIFRFGTWRANVGVDIYNVLNAATPLAYNQAFIPNGAWMTPTQVMSARFAKLSLQLDF